jgi:hypothetical protein
LELTLQLIELTANLARLALIPAVVLASLLAVEPGLIAETKLSLRLFLKRLISLRQANFHRALLAVTSNVNLNAIPGVHLPNALRQVARGVHALAVDRQDLVAGANSSAIRWRFRVDALDARCRTARIQRYSQRPGVVVGLAGLFIVPLAAPGAVVPLHISTLIGRTVEALSAVCVVFVVLTLVVLAALVIKLILGLATVLVLVLILKLTALGRVALCIVLLLLLTVTILVVLLVFVVVGLVGGTICFLAEGRRTRPK